MYPTPKQPALFADVTIRETPAKQPKVYVTPVCRVSMIREGEFAFDQHRIESPQIAIDYFVRYFRGRGEDREVFLALALDVKKKTIHLERVSVGSLDAAIVHPREVFKSAVLVGASAVLLAHNHPSGDATPSRQDIAITKQLAEAGKILGVDVLDHIVVGDGYGVSLKLLEAF